MRIIGITGGIGSGKSKVLSILETRFDATTCRTDEVARELQKKGTACFLKIVHAFGTGVLGEDGELDREKLGSLVFAEAEQLTLLNQIVHPAVFSEVKRRIEASEQNGKPFFILESALPKEAHMEELCDEIWLVDTKPEIRTERLMESRKMTKEKIEAVMDAQISETAYRMLSDVIIDNSGSEEETFRQIKRAIEKQ